MASTTSTRIWRVSKAAGRPWPVLDEDDVIDYMVMEAVALRVAKEDSQEEKKRTAREWRDTRNNKEAFDNLRAKAGA